ncbi:hypothetical protein TNCV_2638281 [Trichonephila clavipes]|nr:hypothetical protein TNCV_2638281 [Trichonephila clavipes]
MLINPTLIHIHHDPLRSQKNPSRLSPRDSTSPITGRAVLASEKKSVIVEPNVLTPLICISDEAHFWLNGYVNKQNCRIWSEANPPVYVETPLHPEKTDCLVRFMGGWNHSSVLLQKRSRPQRYSQW